MGQPSGSGHFSVELREENGELTFNFSRAQSKDKLVIFNLKELNKKNLNYKISLTFDGSIAKMYIDGEEVSNCDVGNIGGSANTANWSVGNLYNGALDDYRRTGDPAFKGIIDDIRFYNRALTSIEIGKLENGIEPTNGLVAKYDFEGTTPLKDKTNNGYDAWLTNTPIVVEWGMQILS